MGLPGFLGSGFLKDRKRKSEELRLDALRKKIIERRTRQQHVDGWPRFGSDTLENDQEEI